MKPSNWMTIFNPSPSRAQSLKSEDPSREAIVQYQLVPISTYITRHVWTYNLAETSGRQQFTVWKLHGYKKYGV
jgi:hypothetical protein